MIRFGCLGSGNRGNALVVEVAEGLHTTRVLVDCGFALRETVARLARLDLGPADISAVIVTHEHSGESPASARPGRGLRRHVGRYR